MYLTLAPYLGLIATTWMVIGVVIAGKRYPNYSHIDQFCSELGASGSPTEKISPIINNFPLSILFILFGWFIAQQLNTSILLTVIAWSIIAHGIGTLVAGIFPMDADPYIENPSNACNIHSGAGVLMLLSLNIAMLITPFASGFSDMFKLFTIICLFAHFYFTYSLAKAYKVKQKIGLHQRLSYGAQLVWLSGLSIEFITSTTI